MASSSDLLRPMRLSEGKVEPKGVKDSSISVAPSAVESTSTKKRSFYDSICEFFLRILVFVFLQKLHFLNRFFCCFF